MFLALDSLDEVLTTGAISCNPNNVFNGHCYTRYGTANGDMARSRCKSKGGHLPIVYDKAKNDFLIKL